MIDLLRARLELLAMLALSLAFQFAPLWENPVSSFVQQVNLPLSIFQTFFHELSHAVGGVITGGHLYHIQLDFGRGGIAHVDRGNAAVMLFSGYLGPTVWGLLI